jgi:hypothetical protein
VARRGQIDRHDRAACGIVLDVDVAAVFLNDAVGDGEPKSGALSDRLRRKERVENPR